MTPEQAEPLFRTKIAEAKSRGITLVSTKLKVFQDNTDVLVAVCALGALLMDEPTHNDYAVQAAEVLGISQGEVMDFVFGWDRPQGIFPQGPWGQLGVKLRQENEPVIHHYDLPKEKVGV